MPMMEAAPSLLASAVLLPALVVIHVLVAYVRNPLRKVPAAHPLAHVSSLWIAWVRWRHIENATLKEAHARLGPVVCLGPEEISINCVKGGIRTVYGGGFEKVNAKNGYNWYSFFTNYSGTGNMFSTGGNRPHSQRKRMLSNVYSKSHLLASESLLLQASTIMYKRFLPYLESVCAGPQGGVLNMYALLSATTMDIVTSYIFGLRAGSNLIQDPQQLAWFLHLYYSRRSFSFWPQEFPRLTSLAEKWLGYRLSPKWVDEANGKIEAWVDNMCHEAARVLDAGVAAAGVEDRPVVYQQLQSSMAKEATKSLGGMPHPTAMASEVLDHLAAGFDTSGITLNYLVHELSKHPDIQARLRDELLSLSPRLAACSAPNLPDPKAIDALPVLHSVIWETLRLHSAIPGPQPRFTPPQGCRLGPTDESSYHIPGGVRVSASAGLLHLNDDVYECASQWRPDRWLGLDKVADDKRRDMESRWFWAFGSGGRMCVGSHLAVYQMKYIVAALYSNYRTTIVDDAGIEQSDSYTAPPQSVKLMIRLEKLT